MNAQILEHPAFSQKKQRSGLANALETTEEMLVMARAGKWDRVRELENQRRSYLDQCLSKPIEHKDAQLFSDALGTLLSMNDRLVSCVHETKEQYEIDRKSTHKAVALANNYLDN